MEDKEYVALLVDREGKILKGASTYVKYKAETWYAELCKLTTAENGWTAILSEDKPMIDNFYQWKTKYGR